MGKIGAVPIFIRLVVWLSAAIATGCEGHHPQLRLATTTSVDNSGLLAAVLPSFRQETGIDVQVLAVGRGRALQLLRRRDVNVALTHDRVAESVPLKETPSAAYRKIMFNDFLLVGPPPDEAAVHQAATAADAMRRIVMSTAAFVSRGDESGTYTREQQLWHVGAAVVDLRFHRTKSGDSDDDVLEKRGTLHVVRQPSPWSLTATFGERLSGCAIESRAKQVKTPSWRLSDSSVIGSVLRWWRVCLAQTA